MKKRRKAKPLPLNAPQYYGWYCNFCSTYNTGDCCNYCHIEKDHSKHIGRHIHEIPEDVRKMFNMACAYWVGLHRPYVAKQKKGKVKK